MDAPSPEDVRTEFVNTLDKFIADSKYGAPDDKNDAAVEGFLDVFRKHPVLLVQATQEALGHDARTEYFADYENNGSKEDTAVSKRVERIASAAVLIGMAMRQDHKTQKVLVSHIAWFEKEKQGAENDLLKEYLRKKDKEINHTRRCAVEKGFD